MPSTQDQIAHLLSDDGHNAAAFLVSHGHRVAAAAIASDLCPIGRSTTTHDRALAEIVRAWGVGLDAMADRALATWGRTDCPDCAHRVLQGLPACRDHRDAAQVPAQAEVTL
jgi:hypothetical protein